MDAENNTQENSNAMDGQDINDCNEQTNGDMKTTTERDLSAKGNEDKKIFVGGIAYDVTNEDLMSYFGQFGQVSQAQVKYDRATGRSRGFAFVEFGDVASCRTALEKREQSIKNKQIEVKPAKSRENKKVFVGGLPADFPEDDLRKHFEQYGKVEDVEWPFDKQRNARRNFAFVVFEEEEGADRASQFQKQTFADRECDVKKAVPQGKRFGPMGMMGGRGNWRGAYGAGRGGAQAGWFGAGNQAWGQMGYGTGWGDWYGAGAAGNFYGAAGAGNGYGAYGGGYYDDYSTNTYGDYWGGQAANWAQAGSGYDAYSGGQGASRGGAGSANRYQQQQHY